MSTTDHHPTPSEESEQDPGPAFNRDRLRDLDQLRLSSSDRYIAGVAGGLGRHFGVDPIVVRVALAALCVFGGIGILVYGLLWAFVPSDRTGRAIIDLNGPTRRAILLTFGCVVALGILGSVFGSFDGFGGHFAWPLAAVVAVVAIVLAYLRPHNYRTPPAAPPLDPAAPVTPPSVPPRPRRTGLILFWPTVAAIIAAFGVLGIIAVDHAVAPLWWPGTALTIIGIALLVGAFVGRPGGLIPLGIVLLPAVIATTILGPNGWRHGDLNATPTSAALVKDSYAIGAGQVTLDLSQVADPAHLAGRTIHVAMTAGELEVTLPSGIRADVDAKLEIAGDVKVIDDEQSGFEPAVHDVVGTAARAPVHLVLSGRVGRILVENH
ncbi:MAG: PspC domain-containing protein [Marmoricola sp.]